MAESQHRDHKWPCGMLLHGNLAQLRNAYQEAVNGLDPKRSESKIASEDEIAKIVYLDFATHFHTMMDFLAFETTDHGEDSDDRRKEQRELTDKFIALMLRDVILNTEPLTTLQTFHDELLADVKVKLTLAHQLGVNAWKQPDYVRSYSNLGLCSWARYLNISESSCFVRLSGALTHETRRFSDRTYLRITQTLFFRAVFTFLFESAFVPLAFGDKYVGSSLLPRYFDGLVTLPSSDEAVYLLRTSTVDITWVSAINNFGLSVEEVRELYPEDVRGILFVPGYPNRDTLNAELFWQNQRKVDITVLYLLDLYELLRIWNTSDCQEYVTRRAHE
ncbi:hypothetical protein KQH82_06230 [bacterium]|nr:hypothetical protein [bacterium]